MHLPYACCLLLGLGALLISCSQASQPPVSAPPQTSPTPHEPAMEPSTVPCQEHFSAAGLPHRAPLLDRERSFFRSLAPLLLGRGRGELAEVPALTAADLEQGLVSPAPSHPWISAFLIGRCRCADPAVDARLTDALEQSIAVPTPEPILAVEVGMSLLLRDRRERGLAQLRAVLTDPDPFGEQYKAAYYLAQAGDPSGYPQLHAAAHARSNQARIMAIRHAIGFRPYDGQAVDGVTIDVRQLLLDRLADPEPIVRQEVPVYLEELAIPDLVAVLEPVAENDPSEAVRLVAQAVVDRAARR